MTTVDIDAVIREALADPATQRDARSLTEAETVHLDGDDQLDAAGRILAALEYDSTPETRSALVWAAVTEW